MSKKQGQEALPAKELKNFREALKLYEAKQYKKALKLAEGILKKHADHGETLAVKGLVLYFMDKKEEGQDYIERGSAKDSNSYICCHIAGIVYKHERNYEEATKSFLKGSQLDPKSTNMLRDLSQLQAQIRQFPGLVNTRKKLLIENKDFRLNWNALAVAQYLAGETKECEETIRDFGEMLAEPLPKSDTEDSEMTLFKNHAIYKTGDVQRALDDLEDIKDKVLDQLAVREMRAKYLMELGRSKEAEREWRALVKRNPECVSYYKGLEKALGVENGDSKVKQALYERLAEKYPKSDAPKAIPLEFLTGDAFKDAISKYLKEKLSRGVPSTFVMVKPLYNNPERKDIIHEFINQYYANDKTQDPSTRLWTIYYMAQHYCYLQQHERALEYINEAIDHTPTLVELYITKAKVLKHMGDIYTAADVMDEARKLDLQDRFVNTKAVKYMLRAGQIDQAVQTLSLFTRNDANGKGVQDLHDMQSINFLNEQAESYHRLGDKGLALKRFLAVIKVFDEFWNDQYDFHFYATRKGTMRAYLDMIEWEDALYSHPAYVRAVKGAANIYFEQADILNDPNYDEFAGMDEAEKKKLLKKQKKERVKELKKEQEDKSKTDPDPFGKKLLETTTPVEQVAKIWKPISVANSDSPLVDGWKVGYELYLRQEKFPLAVSCLTKCKNGGAPAHWLKAAAIKLRYYLDKSESTPDALKAVALKTLPNVAEEGDIVKCDLNEYLDKYVVDDTAASVLDYVAVKTTINGADTVQDTIKPKVESIPACTYATLDNVVEGLKLVKRFKFDVDAYIAASKERFPRAGILV